MTSGGGGDVGEPARASDDEPPPPSFPEAGGGPRSDRPRRSFLPAAELRDPGPAPPDAAALRERHRLTFTGADVLARHLARRPELREEEALERWFDPKLAHLTSPAGMLDREAAIDRLARAVRTGERIAVFGDYDCDGVTATAILTSALRALGGEVTPLLATRTEGAYGLSNPALARVFASGATLLVTCDCGSSDHERIREAAQRGIDTVVIDHHLVPSEALPALAFLNPHRPGCGFPFKHLASCGLALTVAAGLRQALGKELDLRPLLDLVAIGTVADVAPLVGDNRALVRAGLRVMRTGGRVGLRALAEVARLDQAQGVTSEDIAFRIAPRLNAPGRLGDPDDALAILLATDRTTAVGLASSIEQTQLRRRALQQEMVEQAIEEIAREGYYERPAIVVARRGWHPGVVGIVAGKLAEATQRPTIVVALEGDTGRGSVRGPAGARLHDALSRCTAELVGFGGHQAAAGVHVEAGRVEALRAVFERAVVEVGGGSGEGHGNALARLDPRDDPADVLADFERFEPFGEGNPAPKLLVRQALVQSARNLKGHLKLELSYESSRLSGIFFERGGAAPTLPGRLLDLVASVRRNTYVGGVELQIASSFPDLDAERSA